MIATIAQYQVTLDRIGRFTAALEALDADRASPLRDLHRRSIRERIETLEGEVDAYDRLASGEVEAIVVERLADLPYGLVRARIVAGLSQGELARASGHPVARLERWERDGYSKAAFDTMMGIAGVLPIEVRIGATRAAPRPGVVRRGLRRAGLPKEICDRILAVDAVGSHAAADEIDRRLETLFGTGAAGFVEGRAFSEPSLRFRLPGNADQERTRAYAAYVDGLGALVATCQREPTAVLPQSWKAMRELLFPTGEIELETALRSCWTMGIGVLPLRDPVAFHGACRRRDGRGTIVLKQTSRHRSRWLFDLVHEVFHLVAEPGDFTLLEAEETAPERRGSQVERRADRFAALILTDGKLAQALSEVARRAGGRIARLSAAVTDTAGALSIPVGVLANLVAENVRTSSGRNWWGAANNLQPQLEDAWKIVRDVFLEEADLGNMGDTEAVFVRQLMETPDE